MLGEKAEYEEEKNMSGGEMCEMVGVGVFCQASAGSHDDTRFVSQGKGRSKRG